MFDMDFLLGMGSFIYYVREVFLKNKISYVYVSGGKKK